MTVVSLSKISEHFPFFHQPPPSVSRTFLKFYTLITRSSSIWFSSLQVRKHRDVRPNDGFLRQLVEFDTRYCFPETLYEYTEVGTWALATSSDSFLTFQTTKRARTAGQHSSGLKWLWFDFSDLTSPPPAPPPLSPPTPPAPSINFHRNLSAGPQPMPSPIADTPPWGGRCFVFETSLKILHR